MLNHICGGGNFLSPTLKANYSQMGCRNFLFIKNDGFSAPAIMIEYA